MISRTARRDVALPPKFRRPPNTLAIEEGGTLFMALVAALKTLLQRYLVEDDVRVATDVANRNRPETDDLSARWPTRSSSAPTSGATPPSGGDASRSRDDPRSLRQSGRSFRGAVQTLERWRASTLGRWLTS